MASFIFTLLAIAAALAAGLAAGYMYRKNVQEKKIGRTEEYARNLLDDAQRRAEEKKKESILEAKEEVIRLKNELDREIRDRRAEVQRSERRVTQREETLDKKADNLDARETGLERKQNELDRLTAEAQEYSVRQKTAAEEAEKTAKDMEEKSRAELERVAKMTQDEARDMIVQRIQKEAYHDAGVMVREIEQTAKDEAEKKARNIVAMAIQRCASDHVAETTVSVVSLPNEDMKGRIIGREGRNIRALETATGVDLIIDDTPEAITLSSFDQTRREVARMTLERLIGDGRIHPARIEETVEKCRHDLELQMKREGERAVMELGIHGLHPDLIKLIGRLKYRTSFGQNALTHSMEVAWVAGLLAGEMGVNVTMARRAGLLHDIGKALDHEIEGSHVQIGVDICRKYKENTQIIHAIEAHHGDVEPKTPLAFIIQAADAISAARPGARRENVESYVKRLENLEEISSSFEGVEQAFAVQAGREVRILVKPDVNSDDQVILLARSIAKKIEDTLDYPGQIKVNVIRESRAVEYAK